MLSYVYLETQTPPQQNCLHITYHFFLLVKKQGVHKTQPEKHDYDHAVNRFCTYKLILTMFYWGNNQSLRHLLHVYREIFLKKVFNFLQQSFFCENAYTNHVIPMVWLTGAQVAPKMSTIFFQPELGHIFLFQVTGDTLQ